MKVIDVYDKNSDIRCYGKNIFKTTEKYLQKYPEEYRRCYYYNLDRLELFKVDKLPDETMTGMYNSEANVVFFSSGGALGHELFHMASNDLVNNRYAFESKIDIEAGLIEGMTEYLAMHAYDLALPTAYPFEVFSVMMLEDIPELFRPYFIPSHEDFISLFPHKKDIYSLLYSLNSYNDNTYDFLASIYTDEEILVDLSTIVDSIKDTINSLISIELSIQDDKKLLYEYGDKFMDLIGIRNISDMLTELYPKYYEYADKQINKRIRHKR